MKVLLRYLGGKYYVWMDAEFKNGNYYITHEGKKLQVNQTTILAIKGDTRSNLVQCAHCGELINNDPKSIETHFVKMESERNCLLCDWLRRENKATSDAGYVQNKDGTYSVHETYTADLRCNKGWGRIPLNNTDSIQRTCNFYACRRAGVKPVDDVFITYPNLFNTQVTVDHLNAKKFKHDGYKNGYFEYDLKCRGTVKACVNEMGIVDHFVIRYRYQTYILYYSAQYDKIFFANNNKYDENKPYYLTDEKYNQAKEKIAAIFKGQ